MIFVCVLLFPLGLLSLLARKKQDRLLVSLSPEGPADTRVMFTGEVSKGLRIAILALPGEPAATPG